MTSSVSTLNSLLLNPYALNNAAQQAVDPIKPGAAITARYTVADDGSLQLREFNVDAVKPVDPRPQQGSGRNLKNLSDEAPKRNTSFADITPARAILSPSDEVAIFALTNQDGDQLQPEELTANGNSSNVIEAQFEELDKAPAPKALSVAEQRQQKVANLYAQNLDVIYNANPLFSEAA